MRLRRFVVYPLASVVGLGEGGEAFLKERPARVDMDAAACLPSDEKISTQFSLVNPSLLES